MNKLRGKTKTLSFIFSILFSFLVTIVYSQEVKIPRGGEPMNNIDLLGSDIFHFTMGAPPAGMLDLRQSQCSEACW